MWKTVKLGDIAEVAAGNSAPQDKTLFEGGIYPFVRTSDVGKIRIGAIRNSNDKLNKKGIAKLTLFKRDTILFPKSGASTFLNYRVMLDVDAYVSSHLATIKSKHEEVSDKYLWYYLQTIDAANLVADSAYPSLNTKTIQEIFVSLPPLAEQQRIVAKLDAAFAEIDRAVETCKEQISETVQLELHSLTSLFFSDEFILRRVSEIAEIKGGKRLPKGKKLTTENTGFPYIRVSDFNDNGSVDEESVQFLERDVQAQISRYTISSDDVYVSIAGTIGKTGIVPPSLDKANLTENAAKLVLEEGMDRDFIYFFTRTSSFEKQAIAQTRQAAQPKLALERLGAVELPIYELPQQRKIAFDAKLLTEEIAKIIANRQEKLLQLTALKSAILSQELQPPQSEAA